MVRVLAGLHYKHSGNHKWQFIIPNHVGRVKLSTGYYEHKVQGGGNLFFLCQCVKTGVTSQSISLITSFNTLNPSTSTTLFNESNFKQLELKFARVTPSIAPPVWRTAAVVMNASAWNDRDRSTLAM